MEDFSGECIPDCGARQFQGYDENGLCRSLKGRRTGVQCWKNLVQRTPRFLLGMRRWFHDSSAQQNCPLNEDALQGNGEPVRKKTAHSSLHRGQHLQFLFEHRSETHANHYCVQPSAAGKRLWQSSALVSPTTILNTELAPIGDDTEPNEALRKNIKIGNDEDEEPLEAEVPRARVTTKIQQAERNKNMKIQDMLFTGGGVLLVSKDEVSGDNIELNYWKRKKEKGRLRS